MDWTRYPRDNSLILHHKPPLYPDLSAHSPPALSSARVHPLTRGTDEVPVDVTGAVVARLGFSRLTGSTPLCPSSADTPVRGAALGVSLSKKLSEAPSALRPWPPLGHGKENPERRGVSGLFARPSQPA